MADASFDGRATPLAAKTKILLVEDDTELQELYKNQLLETGYDVAVVDTGAAALETVKTFNPALILLDIMLPGGMNGFDVLEQLQANPVHKNIPVVMLTNLDSEKQTALNVGAKDYIVKADLTADEVVRRAVQYIQPQNPSGT